MFGHVSITMFGQKMQFGLGCVSGQEMCFRWLPMYCVYHNSSVCVNCVPYMLEGFQKCLDSLWLIRSLETHLSTYDNLDWARVGSNLL